MALIIGTQRKIFIYDERKYNAERNEWSLDSEVTVEPSIQRSHKAFLNHLTITQNVETSLIDIYVEHQSPYIAQKWLSDIVFEINEVIKDEDIINAQRSVDYLKTQVTKTDLSGASVWFI